MPTGRYPHPRLDETKKTGKLTVSTSTTTTHQMIPPSQISIRTINNSNSSSSSIEPPTINRQYSKPTSLRSWSSLLSPTTQQVDKQLPQLMKMLAMHQINVTQVIAGAVLLRRMFVIYNWYYPRLLADRRLVLQIEMISCMRYDIDSDISIGSK